MAFPDTRLGLSQLGDRALNDRSSLLHSEVLNNGGLSTPGLVRSGSALSQMDFDPGIEENVFLSSAIRLTPTWDVAVVIPLLPVRAGALPQANIVSNSNIRESLHNFGSRPDPLIAMADREEPRIGDILFQTQYNVPRHEPGWPEFAMIGQVKLPTGDKDNFLGTGETDFLMLFMVSRPFGRLTPSMNLGFDWTPEGSEQNSVRYGAGLNSQVHSTLTLALDLLGRWEPHGDGVLDHTLDLTFGARWSPLRALSLRADVRLPMNQKKGFREDAIWTVGIKYTF